MKVDQRLMTMARVEARQKHHALGGTGEPDNDTIAHTYARLEREIERDTAEAEAETRKAPEPKPEPMAMAPSLADGAPAKLRTLRDISGRELRVFGKADKLADYAPQSDHRMTLQNVGAAIASMVTGRLGDNGEHVRSLSQGVNTAGGVFITEEVSAMLIDAARARARCFQAGVQVLELQNPDTRLVRIESDPTVAIYGENQTITESNPTFGSVNIYARKWGSICAMSRELFEDSANAGEAVIQALSASMANALDKYILDAITDSTDIEVEDNVGAINWDDVIDALATIEGLNGEANGMIAHPDTMAALRKLKTAETLDYLAPPPAAAELPKYSTTQIANTNALIADFTKGVWGQLGGINLEFSNEAGDAFAKHQVLMKVTARGDFGLMQPHAVRLAGLTY